MSTDAQATRDHFDFDATWAALPPPSAPSPQVNPKGAAGRRLLGHLKTTLPEPLLREFAREVLLAKRLRAGYLEALRVVLGNQAHAERGGYTLEQNLRVDFASLQEMRTINDQMRDAGITEDRTVDLGSGRVQTVLCFVPPEMPKKSGTPNLCTVLRREEAGAEMQWKQAPPAAIIPACIAVEDVPF
jgi:hypothetical protein